jgi:hypothetical protein
MRKIITFALFCVVFAGCKDKDSLSPKETVSKQLSSGTWKVKSVLIDQADATSKFTGMTLNFTSSSFTSTNADPVWPATGTYEFTNETGSTFQRNDKLLVGVFIINDNALVLGITYSNTPDTPGQHIFTFSK